jgi:hypothetical protein
MSKTLVWSIGRAAALAGFAWIYAHGGATVEANCYTKCNRSTDPLGNCLVLECAEEKDKQGKDKCKIVATTCDCDFSEGETCGGIDPE